MTRRYHESADPKRRGWVLHNTWFDNLRWSGETLLIIHGTGRESYFERMSGDLGRVMKTQRILDIDANEVFDWCSAVGIDWRPSPIKQFASVVHIVLDDDNKKFAFRMRWPAWSA
ncbi:MAG: hypothetical protein EOO77_18535 [Oxalobacteraceae bacterium]|nr:MAG: hypothetical protein EOO77_18535 [Oxalobacteraceae bacterium]